MQFLWRAKQGRGFLRGGSDSNFRFRCNSPCRPPALADVACVRAYPPWGVACIPHPFCRAGIGIALNNCGLQADHCLKQGLENATLRCNNGRAPTIRPRLDALPPTMAAPTMAAPTMPTTPTP